MDAMRAVRAHRGSRASAARPLLAVAIPVCVVGLLAACTSDSDATKDDSSAATSPTVGTSSAASPTGAAPASSTSARPSGPSESGGINETVPARTLTSAAPVPISATARPGADVKARIAAVSRFKATGRGPGEVSGPAVRVDFSLTNSGSKAVGLGSVTATLTDHAGVPAVELTGSPAKPFTGSLAPGRTGRATYVFSVDATFRQPATIALQLSTSLRVVQFAGRI